MFNPTKQVNVKYSIREAHILKRVAEVVDAMSRDATYAAQITPEEWRRVSEMLTRPILAVEKARDRATAATSGAAHLV